MVRYIGNSSCNEFHCYKVCNNWTKYFNNPVFKVAVLVANKRKMVAILFVSCKQTFPVTLPNVQVARTHPAYVALNNTLNLVHGCMVRIECAPRRQQFHVAPATKQPDRFVRPISLSLQWVLRNTLCKATITHSQSHTTMVQRDCLEAECNTV